MASKSFSVAGALSSPPSPDMLTRIVDKSRVAAGKDPLPHPAVTDLRNSVDTEVRDTVRTEVRKPVSTEARTAASKQISKSVRTDVRPPVDVSARARELMAEPGTRSGGVKATVDMSVDLSDRIRRFCVDNRGVNQRILFLAATEAVLEAEGY